MAATIVIGNDNKIFLKIIPLAGDSETKPTSFTVTPTTDIAKDDTDFTATTPLAIGENIARDQPIIFPGGDTDITKVVYASADVIGDGVVTTVPIVAAPSLITAGAGSVDFIRLLGGTTLSEAYETSTATATHFEDIGAYTSSAIQNKSLNLPFEGDIGTSYVSYYMLRQIANRGTVQVYYESETIGPSEAVNGPILEGRAIVTGVSFDFNSEDKCTYSFTLENQATPTSNLPTF